jgi:hypothetical protein
MEISLLTDTGIQFHNTQIEIDLNTRNRNSLYFYQTISKDFFNQNEKLTFHSVYRDNDNDAYYPYSQLQFDEYGELVTTNFTAVTKIDEDEVISISDIKKSITIFKDSWIPVPFFNKNSMNGSFLFGPSGWARMFLSVIESGETSITLSISLAFDTSLSTDENEDRFLLNEMDSNTGRNKFSLCNDTHKNMRYIDNDSKNEWVDEALKIIAKRNNFNIENSHRYIGEYLFLINYLSTAGNLPDVFIHKSNTSNYINVDLVLDIGNSRTCGLLFEDTMADGSFNFTSVKRLEIRNISEPWKVYEEPFSMNLTFHQAKFGTISIPKFPKIFSWPSVLRIGEEAQILLNKYDVSQFVFDEPLNTLSSPKRYLWDKNVSSKPWEFISLPQNDNLGVKRKHVTFEGLTGFLSPEGDVLEIAKNADANWCKSSMMIFVYVEILNHVYSQINSFKFRAGVDGEILKLRKLRSIVITCPTAMSEAEQYELRAAAGKAVSLLENYYTNLSKEINIKSENEFDFSGVLGNINDLSGAKNDGTSIEIIPRPKDINKPDVDTNERLDWIYDEASCSQINFIYAEVAKKYSNNFKAFFEIYGKKELDQSRTLTVATLDIGGGTSDLIITKYAYDSNNSTPILTPYPQFYETYNVAGDDLIKEIIHQLIIDGADKYDKRAFGNGQIRRYAESIGCENVSDKILHFFGEHAGFMGAQHRYYRKYFVKQVLMPIANKLLEYAKGNSLENIKAKVIENKVFTFKDVFSSNPPNDSLIKYINQKFGGSFDFKSIEWEFSIDRINNIIEYKFLDLYRQIAFILKEHRCDFFLLTGKPSEIQHIRNIFVNQFPALRVISLANYQIGTWYPFTTPKGFITDPKTTVAVGAMIYTLASRFKKIQGFRLHADILKTQLISNANYIGHYNKKLKNIDQIYFNPTKNEHTILNAEIPLYIGAKQYDNGNYPSKPIYILDFNKNYLKDKFIGQKVPDNLINLKIDEELNKLRNGRYEITIRREYTHSKEDIFIESIREVGDAQMEKNKKSLCFTLLPANFITEYWLDNGEFTILSHY